MDQNKISKMPAWETHWFQLSDSSLLELKDDLLYELIKKGIKKAGNLHKLCKALNLSMPTFYNFMNKRKTNMVSILKLKKLLDFLNLDYSYLDEKIKSTKKGKIISIENPKFPINLNNKEGAYLLGLIVSDGCIFFDKKSRNQIRTKYAAGEADSEINFVKVISKIYGTVHIQREYIRNCAILRIGTSIVGDSLLKVGAISGRKATIDSGVPWLVKQGTMGMKASYLRAAFDDESTVYKEKKRNHGFISISRYRHIINLNKNNKKELEKLDPLMSSNKFPTGHLSKTITLKKVLSLIKDQSLKNDLNVPSKLLQEESELLNELGINNRFFGRCLNKTSLGRYSLCFDLYINRKESLKKFYKEIGYSLPRKQMKLKNLVEG